MFDDLQRGLDIVGFARDARRLKNAANETSRATSAQRLVDRLLRMHGLPQKLGQILAYSESADSPIASLAEAPSALTLPQVETQVAAGLARPAREVFKRIASEGVSASLSEVRRAWLHNGHEVVLKVQLPWIERAVATDLKALGWLALPVGGLRKKGFDLDGYRRAVGDKLTEELDYLAEAAWLKRFSAWTAEHPSWVVPEPIEEACSSRVLTMTPVSGDSLLSAATWPERDRAALGAVLLEWFIACLVEFRAVHADPHPGNFRVTRTGGGPLLGILDFGCVFAIDAEFLVAFLALIDASRSAVDAMADDAWLDRFVALGFQRDLLAPMADRLAALSRILFEPFITPGDFDVRTWRLSERTAEVLGPMRTNFRIAGPPSLIYFMRTWHGLLRYTAMLQVPLPWRAVFDGVRARSGEVFSVATTTKLHSVQIEPPALSKYLKVRVSQGGKTLVEVTLKAQLAARLREVMPDDVLGKVARHGIDVEALSAQASAAQFAPRELFCLDVDSKRYLVWLE